MWAKKDPYKYIQVGKMGKYEYKYIRIEKKEQILIRIQIFGLVFANANTNKQLELIEGVKGVEGND